MEENNERPDLEDKGKLRRWVSNLQLESWQLELLITGFSIFLLASSLEEYENFRRAVIFDKLSPGSNASNPLFAQSGVILLNTIPWVLRFFLINLLVHLLLRGFWIGIVGLSSVSSIIDFDSLKLRGKFKGYMPKKVRTLDELILYLDKLSSVIFAYTYLLVFSILSFMIVFVIIIAMSGLIILFSSMSMAPLLAGILNIFVLFLIFMVLVCAILFFLDAILFSAFKKSRWFSSIFYYIYRVFSIISLSFMYRSIYYHLITNYKKKQIAKVTIVLVGLFIAWNSFTGWNLHKFYPNSRGESEYLIQNQYYDDTRGDNYIQWMSIPSKFVQNGFLELFIHYDPKFNDVMAYKCPDAESIDGSISFAEGFNAGMKAGRDSTKTVEDFLPDEGDFEERVKQSVQCLSQIFQIRINDELLENPQFSYYTHPSKGERGFLVMIDVAHLGRGGHNLQVDYQKIETSPFSREVTEDKLIWQTLARLPFWNE